MNKKRLIIIVLIIILLAILGIWFASRKVAQDAGREPSSFRDFFGLGDKTVPGNQPVTDGLSSDFTSDTPPSTSDDGTSTIPTTVSTFTGAGYTPASGDTGAAGNSTDLCPNISGVQTSVPDGKILDDSGNCSTPSNGDVCSNISGIQKSVPSTKIRDQFGDCIDAPNGDVCTNITGIQSTVPSGMVRTSQGICTSTGEDICPNITGVQKEVPIGKIVNPNGLCVDQTQGGITGCSDEDLTIKFTQEEMNDLRDLENRFYKISSTLYTDADADVERSNYNIYRTKIDALKELRTFCELHSPDLTDKALNARVPTPYWRSHNMSTSEDPQEKSVPLQSGFIYTDGAINLAPGSGNRGVFFDVLTFTQGLRAKNETYAGYDSKSQNAIQNRNIMTLESLWNDISNDRTYLEQSVGAAFGWDIRQEVRELSLHQATSAAMHTPTRDQTKDSAVFASWGSDYNISGELRVFNDPMLFVNHIQRILRIDLW